MRYIIIITTIITIITLFIYWEAAYSWGEGVTKYLSLSYTPLSYTLTYTTSHNTILLQETHGGMQLTWIYLHTPATLTTLSSIGQSTVVLLVGAVTLPTGILETIQDTLTVDSAP